MEIRRITKTGTGVPSLERDGKVYLSRTTYLYNVKAISDRTNLYVTPVERELICGPNGEPVWPDRWFQGRPMYQWAEGICALKVWCWDNSQPVSLTGLTAGGEAIVLWESSYSELPSKWRRLAKLARRRVEKSNGPWYLPPRPQPKATATATATATVVAYVGARGRPLELE